MKVVIISGPTASGKTQTSIDLAKKFGGEIVNFDSLLLYKEINLGTAKPTSEELREVPHHMINVRSIKDPLNAADYSAMATPIVNELLTKNMTVYLVGGSGFYLQALLKGMYHSPATPQEVLERSDQLYKEKGIAPFLQVLKGNDPASLKRYHENDHYRIRRAVEHWWANDTPFFEERLKKEEANRQLNEVSVHGWDVLHIYLDLPKEEHLKIIEKRTDKMIEAGLIEEVQQLLAVGFTGLEKPLQSIGYKETLNLIFDVYKNIHEYRDRIITSTRQLAKSQRTWFKRDHSKLTFDPIVDRSKIFIAVEEFLKKGIK